MCFGFMQVFGAFEMGIGIVPADFSLGHFATPKGGAGGALHSQFFAGFQFCKNVIRQTIVARLQSSFCGCNALRAKFIAFTVQQGFKISDTFLRLS